MRAYLDEPETKGGKLVDPIGDYLNKTAHEANPRSQMSVEEYMNKETRRLADKAKATGIQDRITDGD